VDPAPPTLDCTPDTATGRRMSAAPRDPASVSIIVPCLGHAAELRDCLASLVPQIAGTSHQVIVVDSAGDDAVAGVARSFPGVELVRSPSLLLPGGARNLGARRATGELLGFIDADCVALPGWIDAIVATLGGGARLAGGPIGDRQPLHPVAAADNLLQFVDFATTRRNGVIDHAPSCNVAIRREDYEILGGFPSDVAIAQDVLFVQAALARWPDGLRYSRSMRVRHAGRRQVAALWQHQDSFGYSRAEYRLMVEPWQLRAGAWWLSVPLVMAKRLVYLVASVCRHRPHDLLRLPLLLPMTLVGLLAYAFGFRRACRDLRRSRPQS